MSQEPFQDPFEQRIVKQEIVQTPQGVDVSSVEQRLVIPPTPAEQLQMRIYRAKQIVWFVMGLLVTLIGLRFVIVAMGGSMSAGFGRLLWSVTQPFVYPFLALFNEYDKAMGSGPAIEYASLIAMAVYLLLGWGIARLVALIMTRPQRPPY